MKWRQSRRSTNVEDRRGMRPATGAKVGGGAALLVVVVVLLLGGDPATVLQLIGEPGPAVEGSAGAGPMGTPADEAGEFVAAVLGDTEDTWGQLFLEMGRRYQPSTLVLFEDAVQSACGMNSAAVGPFYCPADHKVYIDLSFYRELRDRFGAPGDFAEAYVIAHEIGHHVQNLLGVPDRVNSLRSRASRSEANALSVRMELQADCYAGVWGYYAGQRSLLDPGDVDEGLNAAAAIGDDRIQKQATGRVSPESWTHGSSSQRARWFRTGLESGRVDRCDTFNSDI